MSRFSPDVGLQRPYEELKIEFFDWVAQWKAGTDALQEHPISTPDIVLLLEAIGFTDTNIPEHFVLKDEGDYAVVKPVKEEIIDGIRLTVECRTPKHKFFLLKSSDSECKCEELRETFFGECEEMTEAVSKPPKKIRDLKMSTSLRRVFKNVINCLFNMYNGECDHRLKLALADALAEEKEIKAIKKDHFVFPIERDDNLLASGSVNRPRNMLEFDLLLTSSDSGSVEPCTDPEDQDSSITQKSHAFESLLFHKDKKNARGSIKTDTKVIQQSKESLIGLKNAFVALAEAIGRIELNPRKVSFEVVGKKTISIVKNIEDLLNYVEQCLPTNVFSSASAATPSFGKTAREMLKLLEEKIQGMSVSEDVLNQQNNPDDSHDLNVPMSLPFASITPDVKKYVPPSKTSAGGAKHRK